MSSQARSAVRSGGLVTRITARERRVAVASRPVPGRAKTAELLLVGAEGGKFWSIAVEEVVDLDWMGEDLAVLTRNGVELRSGDDGALRSTIELPVEGTRLVVAPVGHRFIVGGDDGSVLFVDDAGRSHWLWRGTAAVTALSLAPSGEHVAVGLADASLAIVFVATGSLLRHRQGQGRYLFVKGHHLGNELWPQNALEHQAPPLDTGLMALAFSPCGRFLATGTERGQIAVWDWECGLPVFRPQEEGLSHVRRLVFLQGGGLLLGVARDVCLWALPETSSVRRISERTDDMWDATLVGDVLAVGSQNGWLRWYDIGAGIAGKLPEAAPPGPWIEVDFAHLMDALTQADELGHRLRPHQAVEAQRVFEQEGIDQAEFIGPIEGIELRRLAIIADGMAAGVYRYDEQLRRAFRWCSRKVRPLHRYPQREMHEVTLSYTREDLVGRVRPLLSDLRREGVAAFAVDVEDDPYDPMWPLRFREGAFRSRYLLLLLSPDYLRRDGSRVELVELARLTARHRGDEHGHPLWLDYSADIDPKAMVQTWENHPGLPHDLLDEGRELLDSNPAIPLDWSVEDKALFFTSLARGARALERNEQVPDVDYLALLLPSVTGSRTEEGGLGLSLAHPWRTDLHFHFRLEHDGLLRFHGVVSRAFEGGHEPLVEAIARLGAEDAEFVEPAEPNRDEGSAGITLCADREPEHAAWSPDGSAVALSRGDFMPFGTPFASVVELDGTVRWAIESKAGRCLAWSPDGGRLATGGPKGRLTIFDATNGRVLHVYTVPAEHLTSLAWSPRGDRVAFTLYSGTAVLLDVHDGGVIELGGHRARTVYGNNPSAPGVSKNYTFGASWSPRGERLATGGTDCTVRVWDPEKGEEMAVLEGHTDNVWSTDWSPDGSLLASASRDGTIRIWSVPTFQESACIKTSGEPANVRWSPDGMLLAADGQASSELLLWSPSGERKGLVVRNPASDALAGWSPDATRMLFVGQEGVHIAPLS